NIQWEKDHLSELIFLVVHRQIDIGCLKSFLFVEDEFFGNEELAVLDFYKTAAGASSCQS
ncbi:MAG: hypothetical protein U9P10_09940, partial [Thermodesulfobacteriota bacterium]|nr:hypothetical protein [Thermodesulfobacteriota bacterium]